MTPRTLLRAAACLLAILPSPAPADSTGRLQFLYTAFMDVRGLAANTLEHCARDDPQRRPCCKICTRTGTATMAAIRPNCKC